MNTLDKLIYAVGVFNQLEATGVSSGQQIAELEKVTGVVTNNYSSSTMLSEVSAVNFNGAMVSVSNTCITLLGDLKGQTVGGHEKIDHTLIMQADWGKIAGIAIGAGIVGFALYKTFMVKKEKTKSEVEESKKYSKKFLSFSEVPVDGKVDDVGSSDIALSTANINKCYDEVKAVTESLIEVREILFNFRNLIDVKYHLTDTEFLTKFGKNVEEFHVKFKNKLNSIRISDGSIAVLKKYPDDKICTVYGARSHTMSLAYKLYFFYTQMAKEQVVKISDTMAIVAKGIEIHRKDHAADPLLVKMEEHCKSVGSTLQLLDRVTALNVIKESGVKVYRKL